MKEAPTDLEIFSIILEIFDVSLQINAINLCLFHTTKRVYGVVSEFL